MSYNANQDSRRRASELSQLLPMSPDMADDQVPPSAANTAASSPSLGSEAPSQTLSEFVRKRFTGETPVFGGDPRVGVREITSASAASLQAAIEGLSVALKNYTPVSPVRIPGWSRRQSSSGGGQGFFNPGSPSAAFAAAQRVDSYGNNNSVAVVPSPRRGVSAEGITTEMLERAAELDPARLRLFLDVSAVDKRDQDAYMALLVNAQISIQRKRDAIRTQSLRKQASYAPVSYAADEEIGEWVPQVNVSHLITLLDLEDINGKLTELRLLLARALLHDSKTMGRMTNRGLAQVGDSALQLLLIAACEHVRKSVSDTSQLLQATQSNQALRDVATMSEIVPLIVAGDSIDVGAKGVAATVVEAIYGALYVVGGMELVERVNAKTKLRVFDPVRLATDKSLATPTTATK